MDKTNIFIISAPSGSGKSTLVERLLKGVPGLVFSISYTTRRPRGHEQDGREYFFVGHAEFEEMIRQDKLLEWAKVFNSDYYGTACRFLDEAREKGCDLVLDIDVQGARQVKQRFPEAHSIFILPPSRREMENRLRRRGEDAEDVIQRRVRSAVDEIQGYSQYDYVIVNDQVDEAAEKLLSIVLAARWKSEHPDEEPSGEVCRWFEISGTCRTRNAQARVGPILDTFWEERARGSH